MKSDVMNRQLILAWLAGAVWLAPLAATAQAPAQASSPQVQAPASFEQVQLRLNTLVSKGVPASNYSVAKAQCWLDTARSQRDENDRSGYVDQALAESARITAELETRPGTNPGFETPLIARSNRLRDDLWAQLALLKNQPETLICSGRSVACAEVWLVRAGHADAQTGWRQANPYVEMAQDGLRRARDQAAACVAVPAPPVAAAVPVASAPAAPAAVVSPRRFDLAGDALFKFNESGRSAMLDAGRVQLDKLAVELKSYPRIEKIRVVGHTDRLGSPGYNDRLSYERAVTVMAYLEALGVHAQETVVQGLGEKEPVSNCPATLARAALIQCLQPDRRVTVEVTGAR